MSWSGAVTRQPIARLWNDGRKSCEPNKGPSIRSLAATTTAAKVEMDEERVQEIADASMIDATVFPAISEQRPRRLFLGVQVPTHTVGPGFHSGKHKSSKNDSHPRAVEVLGQERSEDGDYVYALFDDNVVRRIATKTFLPHYRSVMDNYIERKANGTLLPFDYSGGPPYVHPDSRMRNPLKVKITRQQLNTISSSGGENILLSEEDADDDDGRSVESAESSESSSEGYEEDEAVEGVRRSIRTQKRVKPPALHPSPRKTRPKGQFLTKTKHRPPPATSGSDVDADSSRSGSDSDVQIVEPPLHTRPRRAPQQPSKIVPRAPPGPAKVKVVRVPRPLQQAYGVVVPLDEGEVMGDGDPLLAHRHTCGICLFPPSHIVIQRTKQPKESAKGGWIRCMRCTEAVHWKCLNNIDKAEILRAARLRENHGHEAIGEDQPGSAPPERQTIDYDEMTDFICGSCNQGGICFECHRDLKTGSQPSAPNDQTTMEVVDKPGSGVAPPTSVVDQTAAQSPTELLFRCVTCQRAAHYAHLRSPWEEEVEEAGLIEQMAVHYQTQYSWQCDDCSSYDAAVDKILAWRPYPANAPVLAPEEVEAKRFKDPWPREYLVKWVGKSYRRTTWVPHLWLVSTTYQKLRHFILNGTKARLEHLRSVGAIEAEGHDEEEIARRRVYEEEGGPPLPNPRAEECIPDQWKRVEQVLDIQLWAPHKRINKLKTKQTNAKMRNRGRAKVVHSSASDDNQSDRDEAVNAGEMAKLNALRERSCVTGTLFLSPDTLETPLARKKRYGGEPLGMEDIDDVVWCYTKWGELEYQEASWDTPPKRGDPEWDDFEAAFTRYVQSQAVFVAKMSPAELKARDARAEKKFASNKMEVKQSYVTEQGRNLRPFQVDGVNWLSFQWWRGHPAILADEMGLGKTVQIITFIAKLVEKKMWPHLILVPNSTILNWMREFQTWAPNVRAVPYYGDAASRDVIRKYEIFKAGTTSGQTNLKVHVLVTTYETFLSKQEWAPVFKAPSRWETLVIDEGQRLKNNASLLFQRLNTINVGHRVLMTGTPLNNNLRELFNLMNFVDPENWPDVEELERQYQQDLLTPAHVTQLHERLKKYFLRRTKEILNLPQKHELIVPVSLSKLQKGIYKSLIESNLSLLNTLVSSGPTTKGTKTNLRNILMQSRKCVQHPYLVDNDLEPVAQSYQEMHRQLIDASGKLKFLEPMLRNLKARGRRVLLFSQFVIALDIIEDFVVGEGYKFLRLDGDLKGSLRQKDIDRFNAPDSEYFIYLLSTRAGGVGINLATADTVIIFDPDFNPHQDAQAIARAHRFGQKNPVIVFRMMAVTGPEKKIMHAGKKKLLLDHVIVQSMEEEEPAEDLEAMLLSGAKALFEGGEESDIVYTEKSIDSMIENAIQEASKAKEVIAESSALTFEFAQIWESSNEVNESNDVEVDTDFWAKMIAKAQEEKEKKAAQEVAESGRGASRRAKATVTYQMAFEDSPPKKPAKAKGTQSDDVDYHEQDSNALTDSRTEATSDEGESHIQLLNIVQGEVKELQESTTAAMEAKERKNRARRGKRAQKRLQMEEDLRLATQYVAQASAANQGTTNGINSSLPTGPANGNLSATHVLAPAAVRAPQPLNGAMPTPAMTRVPLPQIGVAARPATAPIPQLTGVVNLPPTASIRATVTETREAVCALCKTRHGMNACPRVQTVEDRKAVRAMLLRSHDGSEDMMHAIQCLDEDIARLEAEDARKARPHQVQRSTLHNNNTAASSFANTAPNETQASSTAFAQQKNQVNAQFLQNKLSYPAAVAASFQHQNISNGSLSYNTNHSNQGNPPSSQPMKKRPPDGPIFDERPTKKPNVGSLPPALCVLCNQPFHPVVDCIIMSADAARMKQRLDQLAANRNPAAQVAIQALTRQYTTKLKQAARPPTKYIDISD